MGRSNKLISTDETSIGGRYWLHAVVRDPDFGKVMHEYYFSGHAPKDYLEVVYSKGEYNKDFEDIILTVTEEKSFR